MLKPVSMKSRLSEFLANKLMPATVTALQKEVIELRQELKRNKAFLMDRALEAARAEATIQGLIKDNIDLLRGMNTPIQPLNESQGQLVFKSNKLIAHLVSIASINGIKLHDVLKIPSSVEEKMQVIQLTGISLTDYCKMKAVPYDKCREAVLKAVSSHPEHKDAIALRDKFCK